MRESNIVNKAIFFILIDSFDQIFFFFIFSTKFNIYADITIKYLIKKKGIKEGSDHIQNFPIIKWKFDIVN